VLHFIATQDTTVSTYPASVLSNQHQGLVNISSESSAQTVDGLKTYVADEMTIVDGICGVKCNGKCMEMA